MGVREKVFLWVGYLIIAAVGFRAPSSEAAGIVGGKILTTRTTGLIVPVSSNHPMTFCNSCITAIRSLCLSFTLLKGASEWMFVGKERLTLPGLCYR